MVQSGQVEPIHKIAPTRICGFLGSCKNPDDCNESGRIHVQWAIDLGLCVYFNQRLGCQHEARTGYKCKNKHMKWEDICK